MLNLLARRLLQLIPTIFFVSIIIFLLQQLLPGDPATIMAGEEADPQVIAEIRRQYRLDQPLPIQYLYWIGGVLTGDLGESMRLKVSVAELVIAKFPVTLQLAFMAIIIALLIGVTAGVVSAVKRDTWIDYAVNVLSLWGISTPNFWLGIMLILCSRYSSAGCRRQAMSAPSRISGARCRPRSCRPSSSAMPSPVC